MDDNHERRKSHALPPILEVRMAIFGGEMVSKAWLIFSTLDSLLLGFGEVSTCDINISKGEGDRIEMFYFGGSSHLPHIQPCC